MVKKWYTSLLDELHNSYNDILVISDPDNLSSIEYLQNEIPDDFIIHIYKNEMGLRKFQLKNGSSEKKQIIFRSSETDYFPSDIESKAEQLNWSIKAVFSGLDEKIVRCFPPKLYQTIYNKYAVSKRPSGFADADKTLNLVCSWLWRIKLHHITTKEGMILLLSSIYDDCDAVPLPVKEWINTTHFDLPESILSGSEQFNEWLVSKLEQFNESKHKNQESDIDFESDKLIIVRDKIRSSEYRTRHLTMKDNIESIRSILDTEPVDWFAIADKWGELSYLKDGDSGCNMISEDEYLELDNDITEMFEPFIINHHKDQFHKNSRDNLFTIDRVLQYIRYLDGEKKLLFCFDGMGFQEWYCIKSYLNEHGLTSFKENAMYAMLPTVTSISRGALFNGEKDISKHKPDDSGFTIAVSRWNKYSANETLCLINADMKWHEWYKDHKCLGIVVNVVDDTAHDGKHINCNKRLMQKILSVKLEETELAKIFRNFLDVGYKIFITSDHGTIWCKGNDLSIDKYLVNSRSKRALIYPEESLAREFYYGEENELYLYNNKGVLGEKSVIFPKGRSMFAKKKYTAISHGGVHIEEVIVPFIEVVR